MNNLLREALNRRRPSDALADVLRSFAVNAERKKKKKSVHFGIEVVLKQCVVDGDVNELAVLVEKHGNGLVNQLDSFGMPLTVRAVVEDQAKVLDFLIKKGVDLTLSDCEGWTALHAAVACGDVRATKSILKAGKNSNLTNYKTIHGLRPIDLAETVEMAHLLLVADLKAFRIALQKFTSEKTENESPKTLATLCVSKEEASLVSALLSMSRKEAQRSLRHKEEANGHSLLHAAAGKNFPKLALLLLDMHLIEVDHRDHSGWTPLHTAAYYNVIDMVLLLRMYGGDIAATDDDQLTPAHLTDDPLVGDILYELM